MASRIRVGVIGVGHVGAHHVRILSQLPGWELAGVFDIGPQKNQDVAAQYGLPVMSSVELLIDACAAVVICTPAETHSDIAGRVIAQGRQVLVEKPLCVSRSESDRLVGAARRAGVVAAVGHVERFNPALTAIRDRIVSARFIEAHRLNLFTPRGLKTDVILEVMIHDIDLVRYLLGADPVEIRASGVPVLSDTDDIANCRLVFADGCVANLTASRISVSPMRKLRVFSPDHYATLDLAAGRADSYRLFRDGDSGDGAGYAPVSQWQGRAIGHQSFTAPELNPLRDELLDFHAAIVGRRPPCVDFAEAARSLAIALDVAAACRESARLATESLKRPQLITVG